MNIYGHKNKKTPKQIEVRKTLVGKTTRIVVPECLLPNQNVAKFVKTKMCSCDK